MQLKKMKKKCDEVSKLLKHLAHPERLRILCFLADGEKNVQEIQAELKISQSQTSQFLKRMQAQGILGPRKEKNYVYYFIKDMRVKKLLVSMQNVFCK